MSDLSKSKTREGRSGSVRHVFDWLLNDGSESSRVDGPHIPNDSEIQPSGENARHSHDESSSAEIADVNPDQKVDGLDVDSALASHVSPLLQQLQNRIDELNHKEQLVYSKLAEVDQERRKVRLWAREIQRELEEREQRILLLEDQLQANPPKDKSVDQSCSQENGHLDLSGDSAEPIAGRDHETREAMSELRQVVQQPIVENFAVVMALACHLVEENTRLDKLASGKVEAIQLDELEQRQREFEQESQSREQEIEQRERTLEKRTRFQQIHLEKLRSQIEQAQDQFHVELQNARTWVETDRTRNRLVAQQLKKFRALLEERELSIQREREAIRRGQRNRLDEVEQNYQHMLELKAASEAEQNIQSTEIRRQHELLSYHSGDLEKRRARIDSLREDLLKLHAKTVEMRLAVDQAWEKLVAAAGEDEAIRAIKETESNARQEIERMSQSLKEHFDQYQAAINELRELEQNLGRVVENHMQEVATAGESLDEKRRQIHQQLEALQAERQTWMATEQRWQDEKFEAEGIIRELLTRLEEQPFRSS